MKNNNGSCIESIKLDDFSSTPISVSVNDKQLPLKIGSKIEIEEKNSIVRTN